MHIHLDPVGGIAGDMFVAAMVDALPQLADTVSNALAAVDLGADIRAELIDHNDGVLGGTRFRVTRSGMSDTEQTAGTVLDGETPQDCSIEHSVAGHEHRSFSAICDLLSDAPLDDEVRARALDIFDKLAEAEGHVHGIDPADVTFHEVGAWDSISDIVAAAAVIVGSGATSWSISPLPLGGGTVRTAHGELPVPAPATAVLLEGFTVVDDGVGSERVTPTGAAILRSLRPTSNRPGAAHQLGPSGMGFGSRRLVGRSNVLRVLALLPLGSSAHGADDHLVSDTVGMIEFDIDDQPAEDLAVGLDRLRTLPGVLDVVQRSALGKKGRLVIEVRILCAREALDSTTAACFLETTTLGVRRGVAERMLLTRTIKVDHGVRVKTVTRPDGSMTAKADIDDLARAGDRRAREALRHEIEPDSEDPNG